jgi:hypothetical protein
VIALPYFGNDYDAYDRAQREAAQMRRAGVLAPLGEGPPSDTARLPQTDTRTSATPEPPRRQLADKRA